MSVVPAAAGSFASVWAIRAERWSDRLNPVLVREARRALNGRPFYFCFFLLLLGCVVTSLFAGLGDGPAEGRGREVFAVVFLCFCGVSLFGLPLMVAEMIGDEVKDPAFEMLAITTLSPAKLLRGYLVTAAGMLLFYASAVAPFLAFSYLLGGIDSGTIAVSILLILLVWGPLVLIAVGLAVHFPAGSVSRVILALLAMGGWALAGGIGGSLRGGMEDLTGLAVLFGVGFQVGGVALLGALGKLDDRLGYFRSGLRRGARPAPPAVGL